MYRQKTTVKWWSGHHHIMDPEIPYSALIQHQTALLSVCMHPGVHNVQWLVFHPQYTAHIELSSFTSFNKSRALVSQNQNNNYARFNIVKRTPHLLLLYYYYIIIIKNWPILCDTLTSARIFTFFFFKIGLTSLHEKIKFSVLHCKNIRHIHVRVSQKLVFNIFLFRNKLSILPKFNIIALNGGAFIVPDSARPVMGTRKADIIAVPIVHRVHGPVSEIFFFIGKI